MAIKEDKPSFKEKDGPKLQDGKKDQRDELTPPPHAIGPEKSVLSSMIQDPEEYIGRAVEGQLTAAHFYMPSHGKLFRFSWSTSNQGKLWS